MRVPFSISPSLFPCSLSLSLPFLPSLSAIFIPSSSHLPLPPFGSDLHGRLTNTFTKKFLPFAVSLCHPPLLPGAGISAPWPGRCHRFLPTATLCRACRSVSDHCSQQSQVRAKHLLRVSGLRSHARIFGSTAGRCFAQKKDEEQLFQAQKGIPQSAAYSAAYTSYETLN